MKKTLLALSLICACAPAVAQDAERDSAVMEEQSPHKWSGDIKGYTNFQWGNTETREWNTDFKITRATTHNDVLDYEFIFSGLHKYKAKSGKISDNEGYLKGAFRHYWNPSWSWQVWEKVEYDHPADLEFRSTSVLGVHHKILNEDATKFFVEAGLGLVHEVYDKSRDNSTHASGSAGFELIQKITERLRLSNVFEYITSLSEFRRYTIDNLTAAKVNLNDCWGIELSFLMEYDNRPASGKKNLDKTLKGKLVYTF